MTRLTLSAITLAALLAGCAGNPIVSIDAPGLTASATAAAGQADDLAGARQFAHHVRGRYRDEMAAQARQSQWLNSGLVVLGSAVLGLAAGDAHRDAILGTSLLGGTAFALGSMNLDRRRLLVLSAGVGAIDCATGAVVALDIGDARSAALRRNLAQLRPAIDAAQADLDAVQSELKGFGDDSSAAVQAARDVAKSAQNALAQANTAHRAGVRLEGSLSTVGRQLRQTVIEISRKVDQAMVDTMVDISAIPQIVAGLGGFASAFAPGAGIDTLLADKLAAFDAERTKAAQGDGANALNPALGQAVDRLSANLDELKRLTNAVRDEVAQVDNTQVSAATQALKACNVAAPAAALAVEPATLSLSAGGTKGFVISGGTRPYTVRVLDGAPEGFSLSFEGSFSDVAQVRLAAGSPATGPVVVLVGDAASPRNTQQIEVTLGAAPKADPAEAGTAKGARTTTGAVTLADLVKALKAAPISVGRQDVSFTLNDARLSADGKQVNLSIACKPMPAAAKPGADELKALMLDANDDVASAVKALASNGVLDAQRSQVRFFPAVPNCMTP
jgi:hypothetical protein